jgi:hypothetical protein
LKDISNVLSRLRLSDGREADFIFGDAGAPSGLR